MKLFNYLLLITVLLFSACNNQAGKTENKTNVEKNEVLVLRTIHSGHLTESSYNLEVLRTLIKNINPDIILTEIPPDRFPTAMKELLEWNSH